MTALAPDVEEAFFSEQRTSQAQYQPFSIAIPSSDGMISITCGYRRSLDLDERNGPGQDFVAVYGGQGFVVGVLADGVSQSFFGDLAAREVAGRLLDHLWEKRRQPPSREEAERFLAGLVGPVQEQVLRQPLSVPADSLLGRALEKTRQHGTQTVFSAFIYAGGTGELDLYQVGDTLVWVHSLDGGSELIPDNRGRWSSTGIEHLRLDRICRTGVTGLLVHSDGLRKAWAEKLGLPQVSEADFDEEVQERVGVDDLSFISVECHVQVRLPEPEPEPLPPPGPEQATSQEEEDELSYPPFFRWLPSRKSVAAFVLGFVTGTGLLLLWLESVARELPRAVAPDCPPGYTTVRPGPGPGR